MSTWKGPSCVVGKYLNYVRKHSRDTYYFAWQMKYQREPYINTTVK